MFKDVTSPAVSSKPSLVKDFMKYSGLPVNVYFSNAPSVPAAKTADAILYIAKERIYASS